MPSFGRLRLSDSLLRTEMCETKGGVVHRTLLVVSLRRRRESTPLMEQHRAFYAVLVCYVTNIHLVHSVGGKGESRVSVSRIAVVVRRV